MNARKNNLQLVILYFDIFEFLWNSDGREQAD